ncbi:MAG TPA: helix-turn-helix domain-containing protein [Mycobacterium sp.]|nr:helix-turn-helix domain-containing protein [Mycobacterium sp.]
MPNTDTTPQRLLPIGRDKNHGTRAVLGNISDVTIYKMIKRGDLDAVKIGRLTFITQASIDAFVARGIAKQELLKP